jgi:hypothetical protein
MAALAAIVHLGATVPPRLLRNVQNGEEMVTVTTAGLDIQYVGGAACRVALKGWESPSTRMPSVTP